MSTVITSPIQLEVGKIYNKENTNIPYDHGYDRYYEYQFLVLRVAAREEFYQACKDLFPDIELSEFADYGLYYEISMD